MAEEIKHYTINGKYRIVIERAASTKGVDGFKVEANGDDMKQVVLDIGELYEYAAKATAPIRIEINTK